jgi:hypothetical protein
MLSGPLYAFLGASWLAFGMIEPLIEPGVYHLFFRGSSLLAWPGVAVIVGWIPLLFPTGRLPGPRWRIPVAILIVASGITLIALAGQTTGPADVDETAPSVLINAIGLELLALVVLGGAGLVTRYRRGDLTERLQIRWLGAAVGICLIGFAGTSIQFAVRTENDPLFMALVAYVGILAMPIAIGIAITRSHLYEIDRLISRTIGWAIVTGVLVTIFAAGVLALQALLSRFTQGQTLAVAASTLVAFALFHPVRRRVQHTIDRRFDRARYDGERTAAAFAERMRDEVDLAELENDIGETIGTALRPVSTNVWLRRSSRPPIKSVIP